MDSDAKLGYAPCKMKDLYLYSKCQVFEDMKSILGKYISLDNDLNGKSVYTSSNDSNLKVLYNHISKVFNNVLQNGRLKLIRL